MRAIERIRRADPELAKKIESQGEFITEEDLPKLVKIERLMQVIVRCGCGRFLTPVQDVAHFVRIIEEHMDLRGGMVEGTDYIRDISLPAPCHIE